MKSRTYIIIFLMEYRFYSILFNIFNLEILDYVKLFFQFSMLKFFKLFLNYIKNQNGSPPIQHNENSWHIVANDVNRPFTNRKTNYQIINHLLLIGIPISIANIYKINTMITKYNEIYRS